MSSVNDYRKSVGLPPIEETSEEQVYNIPPNKVKETTRIGKAEEPAPLKGKQFKQVKKVSVDPTSGRIKITYEDVEVEPEPALNIQSLPPEEQKNFIVDPKLVDIEEIKDAGPGEILRMEKEEEEPTDFVLSEDQQACLDELWQWWIKAKEWDGNGPVPTKTMGGYAGTGKTTILKEFRKMVGAKVDVAFVTLTGKATAVMKEKIAKTLPPQLSGKSIISTMHAFLYSPVIDEKSGKVLKWNSRQMVKKGDFPNEWQSPYVDLFVNDEASMTNKVLYDELLSKGKPVLFVGDHGQLGPVIKKGSKGFNLMSDPELQLTKIHRQAEDNPILQVAHLAREGRRLPFKDWSDKVRKVNKAWKNQHRIDELLANPSADTVVLAATNNQRVGINKTILTELGYKHSWVQPGTRIICLKNNRDLGIYNGMIGTALEVHPAFEANSQHNVGVIFQPDGGSPIRLDVSKYSFLNPKNELPKDVYWKAVANKFDYAYCITGHKSQGSEWKNVIVFEVGNWLEEKARWMYTAITRATEELYIIG